MPRHSRLPELLASLERDGTVAARADLIARFGRKAFDAAVRGAHIKKIVHSHYAHARNYRSPRTRAVAALAWLASESAISGVAACSLHGLKVRSVFPLTIVVDARRRLKAPRWLTVRRRTRALPTTTKAGLRVAELPCALVQAWIDAGPETGRGLVLDSIRENMTDAQTVREAMRHYGKIPHRKKLIDFLSQLRDGVDSYLEWLADQTILNTPDLYHLERQVEFWIDGAKHVVDAYDRETRTAFEFDGAKYHSDDAARRRDIARDRALATIGVQVLRFTFEEVTEDPGGCRDTIRRTLAARRSAVAPTHPDAPHRRHEELYGT